MLDVENPDPWGISHDISQIFYRKYKGQRNIMTPKLIRYGHRGNYVYEVSQGTGMKNETIYGLTVINHNTLDSNAEYSGVFHAMGAVEARILTIPMD